MELGFTNVAKILSDGKRYCRIIYNNKNKYIFLIFKNDYDDASQNIFFQIPGSYSTPGT